LRVLLAHPRGFCAGVDMALETLDRALELFPPPIYAYHQIVHNTPLVRRYTAQGVIFIDHIEDLPGDATVVFSAHGVSPLVRQQAAERNARVIDATCPLVHKVHAEARRFAAAGFTILLVGHRGHDETVGVIGESPDRMHLIETIEDVANVDVPDPDRVAWITQTTLSVDETRRIIDALRDRFPSIEGPSKDDICYATQNRQEAVVALLDRADLLLVVGSRNSSNSHRLAELGAPRGIPSRLIDGPADLRTGWFDRVDTVVLTAGASVPEDFVIAVKNWIVDHFHAQVEEHNAGSETMRFQLPLAIRSPPVRSHP
jgi:4-hydroxy-3-methylbut-2-en-1-yl diphosphate reductase